jgi:hypothetical protein
MLAEEAMRVLRTWSAWSNHGACPPEVWSSASGMTGAARRASPTAPKDRSRPHQLDRMVDSRKLL